MDIKLYIPSYILLIFYFYYLPYLKDSLKWISFREFDIISDEFCNSDYIEVEGRRYCNARPPPDNTLIFDKFSYPNAILLKLSEGSMSKGFLADFYICLYLNSK